MTLFLLFPGLFKIHSISGIGTEGEQRVVFESFARPGKFLAASRHSNELRMRGRDKQALADNSASNQTEHLDFNFYVQPLMTGYFRVWTSDKKSVFTVNGDTGRAELVRMRDHEDYLSNTDTASMGLFLMPSSEQEAKKRLRAKMCFRRRPLSNGFREKPIATLSPRELQISLDPSSLLKKGPRKVLLNRQWMYQ